MRDPKITLLPSRGGEVRKYSCIYSRKLRSKVTSEGSCLVSCRKARLLTQLIESASSLSFKCSSALSGPKLKLLSSSSGFFVIWYKKSRFMTSHFSSPLGSCKSSYGGPNNTFGGISASCKKARLLTQLSESASSPLFLSFKYSSDSSELKLSSSSSGSSIIWCSTSRSATPHFSSPLGSRNVRDDSSCGGPNNMILEFSDTPSLDPLQVIDP
mmetsp:Transcript_18160/g.27502  ORF Transcript_18160/g.27502 Transcript_18160/m.27502 type:complete len:213 (+) Transcript_18160:141-779(+)